MGFLDKLLGRNKDDSGMQTAPPPASMPADTDEHSHDEGEHDDSHEGHSHEDDAGGPPA
jgi:hypothetical protein